MFRSLLVPLDGSALAEQALPWAREIALRSHAALELARVHSLYALEAPAYAWAPFNPRSAADFRAAEQRYLEQVAARECQDSAAGVSCAVVDGLVVDALNQRAQAIGSELIVMTTHGRGPVSRAFLGSVADEMVRRCALPLLLIRPQPTPAVGAAPPCVRKVLVPLDLSSESERAIAPAIHLAACFGASVTLLHVIEPDEASGDPSGAEPPEAALDRMRAAAIDLAAGAGLSGPAIHVRVVGATHVASAIVDEATAESCDVIALATQGRSGFRRLLLGSVADKVLRTADIPLMVCRGRSV